MKTIILLCLPLWLGAQNFVVTQHTSFTVDYSPISLVRSHSPSLKLSTDGPTEAGEGLFEGLSPQVQAELFMSVSRHQASELYVQQMNAAPLTLSCTTVPSLVHSGSYSNNGPQHITTNRQSLVHIPNGLCTGLNQGILVEMSIAQGGSYSALEAGLWWLNLQYELQ